MRVVFMGTPEFAVPSLSALIENHEVLCVITQPDKPKGRGNKLQFPPVKEEAVRHGIEVLQPERIRSKLFFKKLEEYQPDIIVVAAYGQFLPESILNLSKYGCINVHASLLPAYRGAAPIHWSIINGEEKTGITIMFMEKGIDTGDIILQSELAIGGDTYGILHDRMTELGAKLLLESIKMFESGTVERKKQDDALSSYAPMITKETAVIDWANTSKQINNLVRAMNPAPGAVTRYNDETFKIFACADESVDFIAEAGQILEVGKNGGILVKTGDGAIRILELQAGSGKRMSAADYLRGHKEFGAGRFM